MTSVDELSISRCPSSLPPHEQVGDSDMLRRFREAVLPHLDAIYTFARDLPRNAADVEDAVQERCLQALPEVDMLGSALIQPGFSQIYVPVHAAFGVAGSRRINQDAL